MFAIANAVTIFHPVFVLDDGETITESSTGHRYPRRQVARLQRLLPEKRSRRGRRNSTHRCSGSDWSMASIVTRLRHKTRSFWCCKVRYLTVDFGVGVRVNGPTRFKGGGRVVVGNGVIFDGSAAPNVIHVEKGSVVTIGDDCYLNGINIWANHDVTIGDRCIIGQCQIYTTDFHTPGADRRTASWQAAKAGPVVLAPNVWVAAHTIIMQGVTIGADSVVALGTVVRKDVPPGVVVASQEQRIIGSV